MFIPSLLATLALPTFAPVQDPYVVYDINQVPLELPSEISNGRDGEHLEPWASLVEVGGGHLFTAAIASTGSQLFVAKPGGAELLGGPASGSTSIDPTWLTPLGNRVFFNAHEGDGNYELYVTDGSPSGTKLAVDLDPMGASDPKMLTALSSKAVIVFAASTDAGREVWASDGTPLGTIQLADIVVGAGDSNPGQFVVSPDWQQVWFTADVPGMGRNWWATDGTPAGTYMIGKPSSAVDMADYREPVVWNGKVYYSAQTTAGRELCVTDGTAAGTQLAFDIQPGSAGSQLDLSAAVEFNGALYFAADSGNGLELHRFDGTQVTEVVDLNPSGDSSPAALTVFGGALHFVATSAAAGRELFRTNGATTSLVIDLTPGAGSSFDEGPASLVEGNGLLLFGTTKAGFVHAWGTDGTESGTKRVVEPAGLKFDSPARCFTPLAGGDVRFIHGSKKSFTKADGIWRSSGFSHTLEAPILGDVNWSSYPKWIHSPDGQRLLFRATDDLKQGELYGWSADQGAYRVLTVPTTELFASQFGFETLWNGRSLLSVFAAFSYGLGYQFWASDGTAEGTVNLTDTPDGVTNMFGGVGSKALSGQIILAVGSGSKHYPWVSDGTPGATHAIAPPGVFKNGYMKPGSIAASGNDVVFGANLSGGTGLVATDGTINGTKLLRKFDPGQSGPSGLTRWGSAVAFSAGNKLVGIEPWIYDGQSVRLMANLVPGAESSIPNAFTVHDGQLYFRARGKHGVLNLYKVPRVGATPVLVTEMGVYNSNYVKKPLVSTAGGLFYFRRGQNGKAVLYLTQGVPGDSVEVGKAAGVEFTGEMVAAGRGVYITAKTGKGPAVYFVDATSNRLVFESNSQWILADLANDLTLAGGRLFFAAELQDKGVELISVDVPMAYTLRLEGGLPGFELSMSPPFIGGNLDVSLEGVPAGLGAIAISRPSSPTATPLLLRESALWLDPQSAILLAPINGKASHHQSFTVPSDRALLGQMLHAQAFVFEGGTWPAFASNGVSLHVGW